MDEQHLADVVEETIMELAQGANFVVECPTCGFQWAMAVGPIQYAALRNTYGGRAVESRFERLAHDMPAVQCGDCVFLGLEESDRGSGTPSNPAVAQPAPQTAT